MIIGSLLNATMLSFPKLFTSINYFIIFKNISKLTILISMIINIYYFIYKLKTLFAQLCLLYILKLKCIYIMFTLRLIAIMPIEATNIRLTQ